MKDVEKIKQALICQKNIVPGNLANCDHCAYRDSRDCLTEVTDDVIELLEKKKPSSPGKVYFMNGGKWTKAKAVRKGIKQCLMSSDNENFETQCKDCPFFDPDVTVEQCMEGLQEMALDLLDEYEERIAIMSEGKAGES